MAIVHINKENKDFSGVYVSGKDSQKVLKALFDKKITDESHKKMMDSFKKPKKYETML